MMDHFTGNFMGFGSWGILGGIIMWILLALLIGAAIYWLVTNSGGKKSRPSSQTNALEIARQRYAKGEITREEYLQLSSDLDSGNK